MTTCLDHKHCQQTALDNAEAICTARGVRLTHQRRQVFQLIWTSHRPVKAYDLLTRLQTKDSSPQPPTVYRALDFLLDQGLIHRIDSLNAFTGCTAPNSRDDCYFLICRNCGIANECSSALLRRAIRTIASENSFLPRHTTLEVAGVCEACTANTPPEKATDHAS
jgi:Fur family zinc uptake transcriptional regulator